MGIDTEIRDLRSLWNGFWASRVLLTANNFRIFDHLRAGKTAEEAAGLIGADPRGTEILLNALTGLGLLRKKSGKFRNSAMADRFLATGSPHYHGDIIRHADSLWKSWSSLDEAVRTGAPARKSGDHEAFIRGMHNNAVWRAAGVIGELDLKGARNALDLGGGPGTYSIELARKGISVTLFDLPDTIPISREIINESGLEGIDFRAGDFLADDIGSGYDLIFVSQVLHSLSPAENAFLMGKCAKALRPRGRIAIQEFLIDATLTRPLHGALFSVNMLVNTDGGRCYAPGEIIGWLSAAGFRKCGRKDLDDTVLVFGSIR
ncbi:MAG TPA: class I SAM-dependent methyltransferase [Geobacteraceae bacterium]|nr:class I SAM-dependent methyltransferase [Geobacteraceae bacterium]